MITSLENYINFSRKISEDKHFYFLKVSARQQKDISVYLKSENGILLTEWIAPNHIDSTVNWFTLYLLPNTGIYSVQSALDSQHPVLYDLSDTFPVCNRIQRSIYELTRISTRRFIDKRPWLNHGYFPIGILNDDIRLKPSNTSAYSFAKVSGSGVHEIPVGPVHAGIIEPGHFRFSVVGERILKLEARLGYTHKGIHQLLKNTPIEQATKLIGRISGDSTVAYTIAFAMACEQAKVYQPNLSIILERYLLLERERLCHHIGDIGAIMNDAGLPSLQSPFHCLKEQLLRHNTVYTKHRYLMNTILPFSSERLLSVQHLENMEIELNQLNVTLKTLQDIGNNHFGLQDRLQNTGVLTTEQAKYLGVTGIAAKASGIDVDIRRLFLPSPYEKGFITSCHINKGDVAARVAVRFKECFESMQCIKLFIKQLSHLEEKTLIDTTNGDTPSIGIGCVEGWRGPVTVVVSMQNNIIEWCHFHDPSWQNWLAVEYAVLNNIVADFPLINKSFNLSYSGHDS